MSALQKEKPQVANKRPAETSIAEESSWRRVASTQPVASSVAPWKRVKSDSNNEGFLTQQQQSVQPQKPMLGAWFGAAARMASRPAPEVAASQAPAMSQAFTRVKAEMTMSQDSEDDKPLARVVNQQQRTWGQQQQQQKAKVKTATTPSPPRGKVSFATAREAALAEALQSVNSTMTRHDVKPAVATRVKGQEDERVFQLSNKRRVTVRRWKSAVLVDIREYYDDNGVSKPGKKGISLAKDQWNTLMRLSRVIDQAVDLVEDDSVDGHSLEQVSERVPANEDRTIAFTLSSKRRITVRYFRAAVLIDLREYYEQGSEMKPGKKGISLSKDQWRSLQTIQADISEALLEV